MKYTMTLLLAVYAAALVSGAESDDQSAVGGKVQKRGLYGYDDALGLGYGTLGGYGAGSAIGAAGYAAHVLPSPAHYPTHVHTATTITKPVPVPHPYPVPVEKHVPYPVAAPYPVEVPRPYPVAVPRPYPVPVDRPYPVHVDRPYPVAVPVVKHVGVPVPHPYPVDVHHHVRPYPALPLPYHKPLYSDRDLW